MKISDIRRMVKESLLEALTDEKKVEAAEEEQAAKVQMAQSRPGSGMSPSELAHSLDLQYLGWGKWGDASGTPVAMTKGDQLVRIGSDEPMGAEQSSGETPSVTVPTQSHVPGSITPPMIDGSPIEVEFNGKHGYLDSINKESNEATFTTFDGETLTAPYKKMKAINVKKPKRFPSLKDIEDLDAKTEKICNKIFKDAGKAPYIPHGAHHVNPGWNRGMNTNDIPFDANAEQTVQMLLQKIGDPLKMLRWLLKKYQEETPNGKSRIKQYIGVMKSLGMLDGLGEDGEDVPQIPMS